MMPSQVSEYCDYIAQGYFGYTFDKTEGSTSVYPCPAGAETGARLYSNGFGGLAYKIWFSFETHSRRSLQHQGLTRIRTRPASGSALSTRSRRVGPFQKG